MENDLQLKRHPMALRHSVAGSSGGWGRACRGGYQLATSNVLSDHHVPMTTHTHTHTSDYHWVAGDVHIATRIACYKVDPKCITWLSYLLACAVQTHLVWSIHVFHTSSTRPAPPWPWCKTLQPSVLLSCMTCVLHDLAWRVSCKTWAHAYPW